MSSSPLRKFFLFFALLGAFGCGKQGDPAPPLRAVPAPVKDLAVVQQGPRLLLSFTYPQTTPAGTALGGITAAEIYQVTRPSADGKANPMDPREFNAAAKLLQRLEGADLTTATDGGRINVLLPLPESAAPATPATGTAPATPPAPPAPPAQYFAVRTFGKQGDKSDLSNVAAVVPKAPPAAPERVAVTARPDGVLVEWSPIEGATAGYNIYRRGAQERAYTRPIHTAGAQERSWLDNTARFGQSYIYAVTAVLARAPLIESTIKSEVEIKYVDRFPPPVPGEPVALVEAGRVRLVWRGSDAPDLAGYRVYRLDLRQVKGEYQRLTDTLLTDVQFADSNVRSGSTYVYRITAVDQAGNESDPAEVRATAQ